MYKDPSFVHNKITHPYIKQLIPYITKLFINETPSSNLIISYLLLFKYLLYKPSFLNVLLRSTNSFFGTLQNCFRVHGSAIYRHSEGLLMIIFNLIFKDDFYHLEDSIPFYILMSYLSIERKYIIAYSLKIICRRLKWGYTPLLLRNNRCLAEDNISVKGKKRHNLRLTDDALYFYPVLEPSEEVPPKSKLFLYDAEVEKFDKKKACLLISWVTFEDKPSELEYNNIYLDFILMIMM